MSFLTNTLVSSSVSGTLWVTVGYMFGDLLWLCVPPCDRFFWVFPFSVCVHYAGTKLTGPLSVSASRANVPVSWGSIRIKGLGNIRKALKTVLSPQQAV